MLLPRVGLNARKVVGTRGAGGRRTRVKTHTKLPATWVVSIEEVEDKKKKRTLSSAGRPFNNCRGANRAVPTGTQPVYRFEPVRTEPGYSVNGRARTRKNRRRHSPPSVEEEGTEERLYAPRCPPMFLDTAFSRSFAGCHLCIALFTNRSKRKRNAEGQFATIRT